MFRRSYQVVLLSIPYALVSDPVVYLIFNAVCAEAVYQSTKITRDRKEKGKAKLGSVMVQPEIKPQGIGLYETYQEANSIVLRGRQPVLLNSPKILITSSITAVPLPCLEVSLR